jgi:uncharacterized damage-inducible protein DinB
MNDGLIDMFQYNAWANREILAVCRELSDEQFAASVPGVYGSIIGTLRHYIESETHYQARLTGEEPSWDRHAGDAPDLDLLSERVDELDERWQRFLSTPFDAERTFPITWHDGIPRDVPAGVILTQAVIHAHEHRSQICTILTTLGTAPPNYGGGFGAWDYAEVTDRAPQRLATTGPD